MACAKDEKHQNAKFNDRWGREGEDQVVMHAFYFGKWLLQAINEGWKLILEDGPFWRQSDYHS